MDSNFAYLLLIICIIGCAAVGIDIAGRERARKHKPSDDKGDFR